MKKVLLATILSCSLFSLNVFAKEILSSGNYTCTGKFQGEKLSDSLSIKYKEGTTKIDAELVRVAISKDCKVLNIKEVSSECGSNYISISQSGGDEDTQVTEKISFTNSGRNIIAKTELTRSSKEGKLKASVKLTCRPN